VALVDESNNLQGTRDYLAGPDVGWQVDSYSNVMDALNGIPTSPPSVVMMEVPLPDDSKMDCVRNLKARLPDLPVVILTAQADAGTLLTALMVGASGLLIEPQVPRELVIQLRKAAAGGLAVCVRAEKLLLASLRRMAGAGAGLGLSWREQELMFCLCQHRSHKECAAILGISEATVHAHVANVFKKLNVHDRESAVRVFTTHFRGVKSLDEPLSELDLF